MTHLLAQSALSLFALQQSAFRWRGFSRAGSVTSQRHYSSSVDLRTPAVTCSVYSIVKEKLKMLGGVGLLIAALTVWLQRETLSFVEMGIALVPCTVVVMAVIAKRRARAREATSV